jgi:hypothetical protein
MFTVNFSVHGATAPWTCAVRKLLFNHPLSRSAFNAQDSRIRTSVQVIDMRLPQVTACYEIFVRKPVSQNRYLEKPVVVRLGQKFPTLVPWSRVTGPSPLFRSTFESHLASCPYFPMDEVLIVRPNHSSASDALCIKTVEPYLHFAIAYVVIRNFFAWCSVNSVWGTIISLFMLLTISHYIFNGLNLVFVYL